MRTSIDLGWCIGMINTDDNCLTIVSPSDKDEYGFQPASSIQIWQKDKLIYLRDALIFAYPINEPEQF